VGDLNKRKGVITTTETNMDITKVEAEVQRIVHSSVTADRILAV
jgi:hypothetical protein